VCTELHHNKTLEHITDTHPAFVLPSPPTLRRALNPRVGDKLLDNGGSGYQQALLLGSTTVHQSNDDYLLLDDVFYRKNVRNELPVLHGAPIKTIV